MDIVRGCSLPAHSLEPSDPGRWARYISLTVRFVPVAQKEIIGGSPPPITITAEADRRTVPAASPLGWTDLEDLLRQVFTPSGEVCQDIRLTNSRSIAERQLPTSWWVDRPLCATSHRLEAHYVRWVSCQLATSGSEVWGHTVPLAESGTKDESRGFGDQVGDLGRICATWQGNLRNAMSRAPLDGSSSKTNGVVDPELNLVPPKVVISKTAGPRLRSASLVLLRLLC